FDDLYAVAEHLVAHGVTTPDQLGLFGASNGGLLAGAAAVQRPDLFGAIVANVPILDLLRVTRDPFPHSAVALDYGDPTDPEAAAWLATYSPYHTIPDRLACTATLVSGGASDIRCPAWHSRKFVARLQQANTSDRPVLLRAYPAIGHNTGATLSEARLMASETLAFLMRELGLTPPA
ncbi:MAG TPA: prolyl oligopeptidase family serine peptidase, partial [Nitriliruptorales bacterium]